MSTKRVLGIVGGLFVVGMILNGAQQSTRSTPAGAAPNVSPAAAPVERVARGTFSQMVEETGCKSKYSDEKKADIFSSGYRGTTMTVSGTIETLSKDDLSLKVMPHTLTFDIIVDLRDKGAGYDLVKGQQVTVRFTLDEAGGCFLSYRGKNGVVM